MGAILDVQNNINIFILLSSVLIKHRCKIINIDLDVGIMDIKGEDDVSENMCLYELHTIFRNILWGQM